MNGTRPVKTVGPRILWNWMPTSWSRMSSGPGHQAPCPLWMQIRARYPNECNNGGIVALIGYVTATPSDILPRIWQVGDKQMADFFLGKGLQIQHNSRDCATTHQTTSRGGQVFMQAVIDSGITNAEELVQINCYPCHQQVLFVSDVLDASGKAIDKGYLERRKDHINWSVLSFPIKNLPKRGLKLW